MSIHDIGPIFVLNPKFLSSVFGLMWSGNYKDILKTEDSPVVKSVNISAMWHLPFLRSDYPFTTFFR